MQYIAFSPVSISMFCLFMAEPLGGASIDSYHKCVPCNPEYRYPQCVGFSVSPGHVGHFAANSRLHLCGGGGVVQYSNVLCVPPPENI